MSNYEFIKELVWQGIVKVYRHKATGEHIAVSRANTFDRGDETMIFEFDIKSERVSNWSELYGGYGESHETALFNYENGV